MLPIGRLNALTPVIKNLMIINGLFFLGSMVLQGKGMRVNDLLGMHYWTSEGFMPHQILTHMFMHGDLGHIFSNMLALWIFGSMLEKVWGAKRFLLYYLATGLGAAIIYNLTKTYDIYNVSQSMTPEMIAIVKENGYALLQDGRTYADYNMARLNSIINTPMVGASGAVFGILLAFGLLFANTELHYFTISIKAKYLVMIYGGVELWMAIENNPSDNVAHFAHLGGMLFGFLLIKYWNKTDRRNFY